MKKQISRRMPMTVTLSAYESSDPGRMRRLARVWSQLVTLAHEAGCCDEQEMSLIVGLHDRKGTLEVTSTVPLSEDLQERIEREWEDTIVEFHIEGEDE